ncbi:MAG TPA: hypothetical protein VHE83_09405 [Mycobacteriales bacterium]|nr:hypothetical protein [Mycobacteriales bacterium]
MRRLRALPLIAVAATALALLLPAGSASAAANTSGLRLTGLNSFVDPSTGAFHIDGEIVNTGAPVDSVAAVLNLVNAEGKVIAQETAYASIQVLLHGGRSGFDDQMSARPFGLDHIALSHFLAQPHLVTPSRGLTVTVTSVNRSPTLTDPQLMTGTVRNDEPYIVQLVKLVITFYKANGDVAWVANTLSAVQDPNFQPKQTLSWSVPSHEGYPDWSTYSIAYSANENGAPLVAPIHLITLPAVKPVVVLGATLSNLGHTPVSGQLPNTKYVPKLPADYGQTAAAAPQITKPPTTAQQSLSGSSYIGPNDGSNGVAPIDFPILRTARDLLFALIALVLAYMLVRAVMRRQRRNARPA